MLQVGVLAQKLFTVIFTQKAIETAFSYALVNKQSSVHV